MKRNTYYAFLYLLLMSFFLSACSLNDSKSLKTPELAVCPKVEPLSLEQKDLSISIDKVVMIMPEEEKKPRIVKMVKKKKIIKTVKPKKKVKKPFVAKKKEVPKVAKTVTVAPKKLLKETKDLNTKAKKPLVMKKNAVSQVRKTVTVTPNKLTTEKKDLKTIEKNIGDKVCRKGSEFKSFMSLDLVGEVTQKQGKKIQIKIIDSHSEDKPVYNGIGLYKNTVTWDEHVNWRICK